MTTGIVLTGPDRDVEARAKSLNLAVIVDAAMPLPFDKTLFVQAGTRVPWDLVPAAWHFLERWDAAVPLWRYGQTANDVGSKEERKRTQEIVRDLRVLLHSVELLFVRDNEPGQALMRAYFMERQNGNDLRLAFLRALYTVKPRLCVLPISWMAEVQARARQDAAGRRRERIARPRQGPLVTVEISPGRLVKCNAGDEEKVLDWHRKMLRGRNA